jgi:hypothetical protein
MVSDAAEFLRLGLRRRCVESAGFPIVEIK